MSHLFLATLEIMALTFGIGFFVALVIKLIASIADSFDFHNSHQSGLLRLRHLRKVHRRVEKLIEDTLYHDKRDDYWRGINRDINAYPYDRQGVNSGVSPADLIDYYYPEENLRQPQETAAPIVENKKQPKKKQHKQSNKR